MKVKSMRAFKVADARVTNPRKLKTYSRTSSKVVAVQAAASASHPTKRVVVVGGGWAGFGCAKALTEAGFDTVLLDAATNPGGAAAGWRSQKGRAIELGIKGFWYSYNNIFSLLKELDLPSWPLTEYKTSGFWGLDGLITEAPVFSAQPKYPTILGQFIHTFSRFYNLSLADRASIIPWLYAAIDLTESNYEYYDGMSALESFRRFGVSKEAYERFLKPTLLVGLFAPPEQLSAAVTIETLYFYALAHQADFDVCWCKGSISEKIFQPLLKKIESQGAQIKGGRLVEQLKIDDSGAVTAIIAKNIATGEEEVYETDAVVFAISISGMQKLVSKNHVLADRTEFRNIMSLRRIDAIATKVWLDRRINTRFPANVLAGFEPDIGATYFNLTQLQDEYKSEPGTVIAADFYGASSLMPLTDDEIIKKVLSNLALCEPEFGYANIEDAAVVRCPKGVTHFSPGSHKNRPLQQTSFPNVVIAGDWIKGLDHGANGLSQERAWATGLSAANILVNTFQMGKPATILPVEADEPHIAAAKLANRQAKQLLNSLLNKDVLV